MWSMVHEHKILSLFQMEKQSGIQGIALAKPQNVDDLATLNSVIRLMAPEKGAEQPLHKFARFKHNINEWYKEMSDYGLTKEEQKLLKPILLPSSGLCESQEGFMMLVQMPECGGFDLTFADKLRKSIAKKKPEEFNKLAEEYFRVTAEKGLSKNLCNYVWNVLVSTSKGYGFNKSHTLAYSLVALQEMNLAYKYPIIYWNTACLIADSGGEDSSTDYTKIAQSVNKIRNAGVNISLVNINKSSLEFEPDENNNQILFGMKALNNVTDDLVNTIIANRPYCSILDFCNKIRPKKQSMISLIKAGAFNEFCSQQKAMVEYLWITCDKKKRLTLQNMPGLIRYGLLPEDTERHILARRIYEFNRYLKAECKYDGTYYRLDERAIDFIYEISTQIGGIEEGIVNENDMFLFSIKDWDNFYQKEMDVFRDWIKENKDSILDELNTQIFMQDWKKYAKGNVSSWEMEAMCFYYHDHELKNVNKPKYGLSNFNTLPEIPIADKFFRQTIPLYKLSIICGTCIAKNKDKGVAYLLTSEGVVVPVKFSREYFSIFNKQIFRKNSDGTKTILERSWFNRGQKILVQGYRRENEFVAKKYANSTTAHQLYHIDAILADGSLVLRSERATGEEEDDE